MALAACAHLPPGDDGSDTLATVTTARIGVELLGTGFFVDKSGYVMTADHAVANCARRYVGFEGALYRATLIGHSPADDIAVVKIEKDIEAIAVFPRTPRSAEQGAAFAAGYKVLGTLLNHGSTLSNAMVIPSDAAASGTVMLYSEATFGSSGAPVLSGGGLVIGVITHRLLPDRVVATNADRAKELLRAHRVAFAEDDRQQLAPLANRAQYARNITVAVICFR